MNYLAWLCPYGVIASLFRAIARDRVMPHRLGNGLPSTKQRS
ncbi:hypothetical protein CES86_2798 [Brucella lupini]|uniref:Uncharacterized protein n=1 Tax=Brucella lupini TaxID=255457 RepID=A0A256GND5_9HYPH|nr:hypothetical protein CES86_2798 [Brucella lupini]